MKVNQRGFGVVEIVVVIVMVGLLGAVGWLVHDRQKIKTENKDMAAQTSVQTDEQAKQESKDEEKQTNYFEIKELGVKFELSDNLSGLYYAIGNSNRTAYFSLNEFKGTDCAADKTAQVALTRYTDEDFASDPMVSKEQARKIGDYYYLTIGGQAACSENDKIQEKATQMRADIVKLLSNSLVVL